MEILGLQDRTVREVSQGGDGRRVLRAATSNLFAEHAAPGLINLSKVLIWSCGRR